MAAFDSKNSFQSKVFSRKCKAHFRVHGNSGECQCGLLEKLGVLGKLGLLKSGFGCRPTMEGGGGLHKN